MHTNVFIIQRTLRNFCSLRSFCAISEYNAADANPASDFEYKAIEEGGITITEYMGTDTDVVIPEKSDGKNVTAIGVDVFSYAYNSKVVSAEMPDTVTLPFFNPLRFIFLHMNTSVNII